MKAHFEMMARYNAWANRHLFEAATGLSDADAWRDEGAFFRSVQGTLNHLMVGDLLWLARFRGQKAPPFGLDAILHEDREELRAARRVLDADIIRLVTEELDEAALARDFTYTPVTIPEPVTQRMDHALAHFFNHQTHHRGQVHALLTRLAGRAPAIDLLYYQREQDEAA